MNKKLVPVLVVIAVLVVGGYYLKTKKVDAPMTGNQIISEANEFARALESGRPTLCTMKKGEDSMEYMIKGKLMKADIKTMVDSKVMVSHLINDTKYLYIWDDQSKQGSKMAITTGEETKESQPEITTTPKLESQADYDYFKNEGYTIDCKSSNLDDSVFVPPTDIKFIDPSEIMNALPAQGEDGKFDMSQIEELQKQYGGQIPANY